MKAVRGVALLLVLLTLGACASTGGAASANVTRQLGTSGRSEIDAKTRLVLQRNQYVIQREAQETNLMYETQWRPRTPFDDEQQQGARAAETRVIVRARPRSRDTDLYVATMTVENRLQMGDGAWVSPPATPEFAAYARELADELARELVQGIRVR